VKATEFLISAALFLTSMSAHCQRASSGESCFDQGGQADARECLQTRLQQSDVALRNAEGALAAGIRRWQEEPVNRRRALAALKASVNEHQRYRQAQCELQASLAAGGTGTAHRRLLCEVALNEERISHLQLSLAQVR